MIDVQCVQHKNLCYAVIDNMYSNKEIEQINKELSFLETIKQVSDSGNAATYKNKVLKTGSGVFVDTVYADRSYSSILKLNRRLFSKDKLGKLTEGNCFFDHIFECTEDTTLVNFYNNHEKYDAHKDFSAITSVTFFKIGDFSGGQLMFSDYGIEIDPVVGRTVVFPGCVRHEAKPVVCDPGSYRVTMVQFINYK